MYRCVCECVFVSVCVYSVILVYYRSQFHSALSEQLLHLTQLLAPSLLLLFNGSQDTNKRQLLFLFDLIYSILNPEDGDLSPTLVHLSSQSLCRVLQALLSHYFTMMKMAALSILKSKTLLITRLHTVCYVEDTAWFFQSCSWSH